MWHAVDTAYFPGIPFRSGIGKLQVCKHSSHPMVTVQFVEDLMEYFLSEQKGKCLKFAFKFGNIFSLKTFKANVCFLLVSNVIKNGHVRIYCGIKSHMQRNSEQ